MIKIPTVHFMVIGTSEGLTALNSFDNALLNAGIGNLNLIKVSSIIPPRSQLIEAILIPQGSIVPIAYSYRTSLQMGDIIASGIAIAYPKDKHHCALIMEYSNIGTKEEIEKMVRTMVLNGMEERDVEVEEVKSIAIEHKVITCATTFAGVVLWD